jgi:hypothetical protein
VGLVDQARRSAQSHGREGERCRCHKPTGQPPSVPHGSRASRLARKVELEVHRDGWRQERRQLQVRWAAGGPTIEPAQDRSGHRSIARLSGLGGYLCPPPADALISVGEAWCPPGLEPEEMDESLGIDMPDDLRRSFVLVRRSVVASRSGAQAVIIRSRNGPVTRPRMLRRRTSSSQSRRQPGPALSICRSEPAGRLIPAD